MEQQAHSDAVLREKARTYLPGGSFGNAGADLVIVEGSGGRVRDAQGKEYVDFLLGSGPMLIGHRHPEVIEAVREQLERGTTFFANSAPGILLAEAICEAMPCAEKVRFTSSGSEATLYAMRAMRAFRGRLEDPQVRGWLSRHERLCADESRAPAAEQRHRADPGFPGHSGRHPERGAGRTVQRPGCGHRDRRGASRFSRRRDRRGVPAGDPASARIPRRASGPDRASMTFRSRSTRSSPASGFPTEARRSFTGWSRICAPWARSSEEDFPLRAWPAGRKSWCSSIRARRARGRIPAANRDPERQSDRGQRGSRNPRRAARG